MELRHLRYFLAVCEDMNFTKAAERLMMAQPPLSRQIKDLEEELGAPLFIREHHLLKLTDEGVMFRQYAERIISLSEKSIDEIRTMNTGLHGTLVIAGVEGKAPHLISSWIAEFSKEYPDVEYSLWNGNTDDVNMRVQKGLCDVGVITEPYDPQGIHSFSIYEEPWVALFSKEHPLASICTDSDEIDIKKLADYDLIIPSRISRLTEINDWFAPLGVKPHVKARIAHVLNAYELCLQNLGVAIFPEAAGDFAPEEVVVRKIVNPSVSAKYVCIYSAEHLLSPVAQKFVDFVRDRKGINT